MVMVYWNDFVFLPMVWVFPVERVLLHNVGQARLVGEEESQVGGQDAVLHVADHCLVLLRVQVAQQVVLLLITKSDFAFLPPAVGLTLPLQSDGFPSLRLHTSQLMAKRCRS